VQTENEAKQADSPEQNRNGRIHGSIHDEKTQWHRAAANRAHNGTDTMAQGSGKSSVQMSSV